MSRPATLIEVTRGGRLESYHTGSIAVADRAGALVIAIGSVTRPVYPRSAIKSLQCLPLIESGAADRFRYGDEEIALACASHTGTERHTSLARRMLDAAHLDEAMLGCGAHPPLGAKAAQALAAAGLAPTQLHNNCSGKHAGMLATAVHLGEPIEGYCDACHPVQERVRAAIGDVCDIDLGDDVLGYDGCSVPNWAMPLRTLATGFARLGTDAFGATRGAALRRILAACWKHPELVAGPGRADTVAMTKLPGRVFMKTGAEGVYCGAFPEIGLGFALKIDDGATRASAGTAMALIEQVYPEARGLMARQVLKSWRGAEVGRISASEALNQALASLDVVHV